MASTPIVVGVLALQGAFVEHIQCLSAAATSFANAAIDLRSGPAAEVAEEQTIIHQRIGHPEHPPHLSQQQQQQQEEEEEENITYTFLQVRTPAELAHCDALVIPGGESTAISLIAERTGLLEPLREFVKLARKPVWGTCAGLILLAESANQSKTTGQELVGGLDVRVHRNYFGRQVESFEADLDLPFLGEDEEPFHSVFIRAPVVESILTGEKKTLAAGASAAGNVYAPSRSATTAPVEILGRLPGRARAIRDKTTTAEDLGEDGDIIAVKQGNVFGTAFHPELTGDNRIHAWWLREVVRLRGHAQ